MTSSGSWLVALVQTSALVAATVPLLFFGMRWLSKRLIRRTVAHLDENVRERYQQEWLAEISVASPFRGVLFSLGLRLRIHRINATILSTAPAVAWKEPPTATIPEAAAATNSSFFHAFDRLCNALASGVTVVLFFGGIFQAANFFFPDVIEAISLQTWLHLAFVVAFASIVGFLSRQSS